MKNWHLFTALTFAIATIVFLIIVPAKPSFEKNVVTYGKIETFNNAVITVEKGTRVFHWKELKKSYLDALELYYEAYLYEAVSNDVYFTEYFKAYSNLITAEPAGPNTAMLSTANLTFINLEFCRICDMAMIDTNYRNYLKARQTLLREKVKEHSKSPACLIAEANTIAAKINRGVYNDILYTKHEVIVEIPITPNVSYITSVWLKDYPGKVNEIPEIRKEFKKLIPKFEKFKKKHDC